MARSIHHFSHFGGCPMNSPGPSVAIRERITEAIAATDRIEVYLLDPAREPGGPGEFPLRPYGQQASTGIHAAKALEGEPAARLLALWAGTLRDEEGWQAHCH